MKPLKSKGIIFDFNGVLWWDNELQENSWRSFSVQLRGTAFTEEEMLEHVHGRPNSHTMEYLVGQPIEEEKLNELIQDKESIYRDLCLAQGSAFALSPGSVEVFEFLKQHHLPRTIATGSERVNLEFFFTHFDLQRWFNLSHVVYDDGITPGKPAPDVYLKAAQLIGLSPQDCAVIEDSSSGIQAAHSANIGKIFALGSAKKHQKWLEAGVVHRAISSLKDLHLDQEFTY